MWVRLLTMVLLLIMIMLTLAILRILMIRKRKLMIMEKTRILTRRLIMMIILIMMRIRKLVEVKPSVVETSLCAASQTWRLRWEWRKYSKIFGKSGGSGANSQNIWEIRSLI